MAINHNSTAHSPAEFSELIAIKFHFKDWKGAGFQKEKFMSDHALHTLQGLNNVAI